MTPVKKDFKQQTIDAELRDDLSFLIRLAVREDLGRGVDLTTAAVVPHDLPATAQIVAREDGIAAGIDLIPFIVEVMGSAIEVENLVADGATFAAQQTLSVLRGESYDVITCERTILNFLGRLCGIATWTKRYSDLIADLPTRLYDTRKTTPGWRRLEKYAVRCGGGHNHRGGLNEAVLIKDNHLACHQRSTGRLLSPKEAVEEAREFLASLPEDTEATIVEIEVDTLEQLQSALRADPDIVLLDNMINAQLSIAVDERDKQNPSVELEASGGVNLKTIRGIAETGVDRISVGALTHSAINLDLGLDWVLEQ